MKKISSMSVIAPWTTPFSTEINVSNAHPKIPSSISPQSNAFPVKTMINPEALVLHSLISTTSTFLKPKKGFFCQRGKLWKTLNQKVELFTVLVIDLSWRMVIASTASRQTLYLTTRLNSVQNVRIKTYMWAKKVPVCQVTNFSQT